METKKRVISKLKLKTCVLQQERSQKPTQFISPRRVVAEV